MMKSKIRIGKIGYTNTWPIDYYFSHFENTECIEFITRTPTEINGAMKNQELDISPISSIAYAQLTQEVVLLPHLSVSAKDKVGSVLLFHKKPLSEIKCGHFALAKSSATSVHLLKIIMEKFYESKPNYTFISDSLEGMMHNRDAALVIGDDAIQASFKNKKYRVTDLAQEWGKWTGQWITFAVWVVRRSWYKKTPEVLYRILDIFTKAKQMAKRSPQPMIHEAQRILGGSYCFWEQYFHNLCYDLDNDQLRGLQQFYQFAYELGFLPNQVKIEFCQTHSFDWVTE